MFLLVVVVYLIYKLIVMPCVECTKREIARRRSKNRPNEVIDPNDPDAMELQAMNKDDHSDDILREMKIRFLKDMYIRAQKEFELFRTMLNAISYDQDKLSDQEAKLFKKRLKQRIRVIEDTVDIHLNNIGALERFMDRSYLYKLTVLELNESKILKKDPRALRMVDLCQSYNQYDSLDFIRAQRMLQRIDREIMEMEFLKVSEPPVYC